MLCGRKTQSQSSRSQSTSKRKRNKKKKANTGRGKTNRKSSRQREFQFCDGCQSSQYLLLMPPTPAVAACECMCGDVHYQFTSQKSRHKEKGANLQILLSTDGVKRRPFGERGAPPHPGLHQFSRQYSPSLLPAFARCILLPTANLN